MKKITWVLLLVLSLSLIISGCTSKDNVESAYQYYTAEETKAAIENNDDIILLDIQVEEEWDAHHIEGAIPTYAYPVKTDEEKAKLDEILPLLEGQSPIVVVCPGGAGGATRTIDYLQTKDIEANRLFILENGQSKWPYEELLEANIDAVGEIEFSNDTYMVTADWLQENIEREDLLILDARGEDAHKKGHINGALPVMWQWFSNMEGGPGEPNWGTVLDAENLSKKLSEYGITKDKEIVVYTTSPNGWGEEGRIVWMLRRAGFENAKMLDGGYDYWSSNGYEISKDKVEIVATNVEVEALDDKTNITTEELNNKLNQVVIIDVRDKAEYEGATKYGEARGGHIPGAINITFNEFLNTDGTLKTAEEIQIILDDNGIKKDDEIVTYCTAGIRSAHMQIVLDMMGYKNAKNYDASFYAWAGNEDLKVEK